MPDVLPPAPRSPQGHAPPRRNGSVRRTSTVDMTWPNGRGTQLRLHGRARDAVTPVGGGTPIVVAADDAWVGVGFERVIDDIAVAPHREGIERLVGSRGGGHLRLALKEVVPQERDAGTPLYLLLDDISGTSLIAGFAWSRWYDDWRTPADADTSPAPLQIGPRPSFDPEAMRRRMEGICAGFRPGASSLNTDGTGRLPQSTTPVGPLLNPEDRDGWHELNHLPGASMRRARRIDVWRDRSEGAELVHIDAMFQDSAGNPDGSRQAIHEYRLHATADPKQLTLLSIEATPHVLPFSECPSAAPNVSMMIGTPLRELRQTVLDHLQGTAGCTHLNDALRSLAEVPVLFSHCP